MTEENKEGNGQLTDEELLKVSAIDIQDPQKYTDEHRKKYDELQMAARLQRYQKDPRTFIELSDIVLMAVRNPQSQLGISVFVGNCKRSEMDIAEAEVNHLLHKQRLQLDIAQEMKQQAMKNLVMPHKGGILNFVRGKKIG